MTISYQNKLLHNIDFILLHNLECARYIDKIDFFLPQDVKLADQLQTWKDLKPACVEVLS